MRPRRKVRPTRTKRAPVRKARRKAGASSGTTKRNPFTGLVVTGIRSIVAALPLSTYLSPIVDLLLSSVGLAPAATPTTSNGITTIDGVSIYGLCGLTMINYANILVRTSTAAVNLSKGSRPWVDTPYTDAKIVSLTVTATPNNVRETRSGRWGMLFIPFRHTEDFVSIQNDYRPMTLSQLQQMAGSVSGPADRPLQLRFTPKPEDGFIFQFNPISSWFGAVVIAYSEDIRNAYHEFSATDFAPDITIRGNLKLRQPHLGSPVVGYEDKTWTPNYPMVAYVEGKRKNITFDLSPSYQCMHSTATPGQCIVKGKEKKPPALSLEDMALE